VQEAAGEAGVSASVLQGRLADALQPCLETLQTCGLTPDAAQQLHDEVLAYGLGLLVLQGPQRGEGRALMESRFVQSLQQWMDQALAATQQDADGAGQRAVRTNSFRIFSCCSKLPTPNLFWSTTKSA
jgi:hypothetical protein